MKVGKFLVLVIVIVSAMVLTACSNTKGEVKSSETPGFEKYSNNTINVSVLAPEGWSGEVSMGGEYVLTSPGADKVQIIISSSKVERLMANASNVSLEDFMNFRASQVTENNMGPEFNLRKTKSKLAGRDAYEFLYSYRPQGNDKKQVVKEVFTLADGKVYKFYYYADESTYPEYLNKAVISQGSYETLN